MQGSIGSVKTQEGMSGTLLVPRGPARLPAARPCLYTSHEACRHQSRGDRIRRKMMKKKERKGFGK